MEKLVDQSMRMGPLKRFPLERSHHAYQRGGSSETALHDPSFEAIGRACADHEVHFTISRWIAARLSNHMVRAERKGVSSTIMVLRGCPQGGVLSPLLWNMVIYSLLGHLNNESLCY
jgi:hypothetical protein